MHAATAAEPVLEVLLICAGTTDCGYAAESYPPPLRCRRGHSVCHADGVLCRRTTGGRVQDSSLSAPIISCDALRLEPHVSRQFVCQAVRQAKRLLGPV